MALMGTFLLFWLGAEARNRWPGFFAKAAAASGDFFLAASIWLIAIVLWGAADFDSNWFAPGAFEPTYENYPYSDALIHDVVANNVLVGEGFRWEDHDVVRRPFYSLFLAFAHSVSSSYAGVVNLQVFFWH